MSLQTPKFDPKRILIILHGSIGDVTRALPLANLLRKGFPQALVSWSIEPASLPLVQGHPAIDEVIVFDRQRGWNAFRPFLAKIRARKFDVVLDLQRHLKSGFVSWWSGAPQRIGFSRTDAKELNWIFNNLHIEAFGGDISKLDHYLKFAEYLGISQSPIEWDFALTDEEEAAIGRHLARVSHKFAVLFVGTRWQSKQWFPAQMALCADLLHNKYQFDVVLLGGKDDQELAREAVALTKAPMINHVGRTSLREAVGIIQRATIAVGPDTGLMHIAAAVKTPVVSLWGATSPARTGPYDNAHLVIQGKAPCVPCYRKHCAIGRVCLQSISADQIAEKIIVALGSKDGIQVAHANGA
jgi:lipopolysaccharide heptosyltransferase II